MNKNETYEDMRVPLNSSVFSIRPSKILREKWFIEIDGMRYMLEPEQDLTPIELYNIQEWKELARQHACNVNSTVIEQLLELAKELGIIRHFKQEKL
ncbi:hypothetical protein P7F88_25055 [Vibrio hannami]|uniref:hypothetical protein n=1 Tax=Vibrio hannami TaxID=2717094 RepID=UPI00240EFCD3|nr:hypothetical protein [Vibrio hannami]MDG3089133.1 hypothetical protein [Vibrio hannami]